MLDGATIQAVTDYQSTDGRFAINRSYRSAPATYGLNELYAPVVGSAEGWRFDFEVEIQLKSDGSAATVYLPDGIAYDFTRSGNAFAPTSGANPQTRYLLTFVGTPPADWTTLKNAVSNWQITDTAKNQVWSLQTFKHVRNTDAIVYQVARPMSVATAGYQWTYTYDAKGTLQSIADSYGRTFGFTWNTYPYPSNDPEVVGNPFSYQNLPVTISQITLPGGGKLKYTYNPPLDANGNSTVMEFLQLIREELDDASGNVIDFTTYQYENTVYPDLLTGITDARGIKRVTYTYDARGRVVSAQDAGGQNPYSFGYNVASTTLPNELVRTATNPLGKVTEYHWTHPSNANLTTLASVVGQASANCAGSVGSYTYDTNGFVASFTDEEGRVTAYVNDAQGRPTSVTRGSGTSQAATTTMTWDSVYNVATQVVEPGKTTTQTLNATTGLVTQRQVTDTTTQSVPYSTNGQTRTLTYSYDTTGRLTSVVGPIAGVSTSYTYDPTGFLKTITNELGQVTTVTSANAREQPTAITDPNGIKTSLAYDGHGWLTGVSVDTANTPATTTIVYNAVGDVTSITDPIAGQQTFVYDNARRLITITNSAGEVVTYTRDLMGNATSVTAKNATPTTTYSKTRTFDELGRIIKEVGATASNSTYSFGYDKTDNQTTVTDPRSNVFSKGFDALNRLISETDQQNATVTLTRNGVDAITSYKDPRNVTTTYVRNGFGEIIQEVSPDKGTTTYVRDARGLVTQRTDPRGIVTNYTYDNAGRLTGKTYAGQSGLATTLTWDVSAAGNLGIGRLVGLQNETATDWRNYDAKGNVVIEYRSVKPMTYGLPVAYVYDGAANVTALTYPSGHIVKFTRDSLGRVTAMRGYASSSDTTGVALVTGATYNPYSGVKSVTYGNGITESFTRDTDDRIVEVKLTSGATVLDDRTLTWVGATLTAINDSVLTGLSESFSYTATNRLAAANGSYGTFAWTYDAVGNRTSEQLGSVLSTYAYPTTSNKLSSVTPGTGTARAITYDAAGDIVTDSRSGALGLTYQYDVEGRLAKAFQTNATANGGTYLYDVKDRLASRTVTQTSAPTSTTTLYAYDLADHLIAEMDTTGTTKREYFWLGDMPVAVLDVASGGGLAIYDVHVDHLMRPILMTDQSQTWAWYASYKPFGEVASLTSNPAVMNARFPGQWFQLETGLAYNWHRHYDPTLGRYIQSDPLKVDDGDATVAGIPTASLPGGRDGHAVARSMGWREAHDIIMGSTSSRAMLQDGPSIYGYAGGSSLVKIDPKGLGSWGSGSSGQGDGGVCRPDPRNCTDEQKQDLQERVENACGAAARCIGGENAETIQYKIAAHYECINARRRLNDTCYAGGDPGHNQAIDQRQKAIENCYKIGGGIPK